MKRALFPFLFLHATLFAENLDPVIVSATLDATHLSDVPYSAAAISSRMILGAQLKF